MLTMTSGLGNVLLAGSLGSAILLSNVKGCKTGNAQDPEETQFSIKQSRFIKNTALVRGKQGICIAQSHMDRLALLPA